MNVGNHLSNVLLKSKNQPKLLSVRNNKRTEDIAQW